MEREVWARLTRAIHDVARTHTDNAYHTYSTASIVRVYFWAVLHHRPVAWACDRRHWDDRARPGRLPNQSTLSRRLRTDATRGFLHALARRLRCHADAGTSDLFKLIDGKPLPVARHSADPDAAFGRGAGGAAKGYKLHAIYGQDATPLAWEVHPLNTDEKDAARRMVPTLGGAGYLIGDANFDASDLFDLAHQHGHRLIAPRRRPRTGIGHHRQSPHRLACIATLEAGPRAGFGAYLMRCRRQVETRFAHLTARLTCLPAWARRLHRVRLYVHAHLILAAIRWRMIHA